MTRVGCSTHNPHKGYKKYPTLAGRVATVEPDLLPPDPDPVDNAPPEPDYIEGLSLQMTHAMNHYQRQERKCSCAGTQDTLHGSVHIVKTSVPGTKII